MPRVRIHWCLMSGLGRLVRLSRPISISIGRKQAVRSERHGRYESE